MTEAVKTVLQRDEEAVLVVYPKWCWTAPNVMGILLFDLLWIAFFSFFTYLAIQSEDVVFKLMLIPLWGIAVAIPAGVLWCRMRLKRTVYVVTNHRAIVLRPSLIRLHMQTRVWPLEQNLIKQVVERQNGVGDVVFGFRKDFEVNGRPMPEGFISVPEVRRVHEILKEQIIAACGSAAVAPLPPVPATPATAAAEPQITKRLRRRPWWFGLFFVVAGLMDICIGTVFIQDDSVLQENGIRTTPTVVKMRKGNAPTPVVTFRDADGVSHTVKNPYSSSEFSHLQAGDEVEILYMPDTPRDMQIITKNPFSFHWIVWGIGAVFILVGLGMCVVNARKK